MIESVAAAISATVVRDEPFELITHHHQGGPQFRRVAFAAEPSAGPSPEQTLIVGSEQTIELEPPRGPVLQPFHDPRWTSIADINAYLGETVRVWEREDYTATGLFGEAGRCLQAWAADDAAVRARDFQARLGEFT